jgi:uncharacterized membrane protein
MGGADRLRDAVANLAEKRCLTLHDTAVVVRYPDGSVTLNGEPFVVVARPQRLTIASFLAGLALGAPPLTGAAVGALLGATGNAVPAAVGIGEDFVREVEELMKPGTSALFVLDQARDMETILQGIRGLGGTVLKTNVDLERAKLIQSTLAAASANGLGPDGR